MSVQCLQGSRGGGGGGVKGRGGGGVKGRGGGVKGRGMGAGLRVNLMQPTPQPTCSCFAPTTTMLFLDQPCVNSLCIFLTSL